MLVFWWVNLISSISWNFSFVWLGIPEKKWQGNTFENWYQKLNWWGHFGGYRIKFADWTTWNVGIFTSQRVSPNEITSELSWYIFLGSCNFNSLIKIENITNGNKKNYACDRNYNFVKNYQEKDREAQKHTCYIFTIVILISWWSSGANVKLNISARQRRCHT